MKITVKKPMAKQLIREFLEKWHPDLYHYSYALEDALEMFGEVLTLPICDIDDYVKNNPKWQEELNYAISLYEYIGRL